MKEQESDRNIKISCLRVVNDRIDDSTLNDKLQIDKSWKSLQKGIQIIQAIDVNNR